MLFVEPSGTIMQLPEFLEIADGEIRLKGHRIRLIDVAARYDEGHSAEGIAWEIFPTLELSLVHKVIAFYLEHEAEVRDMIKRNKEELAKLAAVPRRATPSFEELRKRMEARRRAEAS